jgi:hypothetical protein
MSYDTPEKRVYEMASSAFGATTVATAFKGPPGKVGYVRNIEAEISADMVGTTTVPEIDVGTASGDATYARFRLGSTAIAGNTAAGTPYNAASLVASAPGNTGGVPRALNDYAGHIQLETVRLPADTPFFITGKAGVGGTPDGTGRYEVSIDWF